MKQTDRPQMGGGGRLEGISQRTYVPNAKPMDTDNSTVEEESGVGRGWVGGAKGDGRWGTSVIVSTVFKKPHRFVHQK